METRWLYTTSENFPALREASKDVCIIPMGCLEKHGLHLALGNDIVIAEHVAWVASQIEPVTIFPNFTFGDVPEGHPGMHAGTVTIPVQTQMLLLEQLCEQIARNGFKKIMIYNGHGGNYPWLNAFLRNLDNQKHDFVLTSMEVPLPAPHEMAELILEKGADVFPEMTKEDVELVLKYHEEGMKVGHACFSETAFMLGICPESVKMDRLGIESGLSTNKTKKYRDVGLNFNGWGYDYPNAFSAHDPIGCNERIGKALIRMEAERLAGVYKLLKEDEDLVKWHNEKWGTNL